MEREPQGWQGSPPLTDEPKALLAYWDLIHPLSCGFLDARDLREGLALSQSFPNPNPRKAG